MYNLAVGNAGEKRMDLPDAVRRGGSGRRSAMKGGAPVALRASSSGGDALGAARAESRGEEKRRRCGRWVREEEEEGLTPLFMGAGDMCG